MEEGKTEYFRQKLWCDVFTAASGCFNVRTTDVAISWADKGLKAFDERFTNKKEEKGNAETV